MRRNLAEVEVLRALGAAGVMLIHTNSAVFSYAPPDSLAGIVFTFADQLSRFSVPLFLFLSGLLLALGYQGRRFETGRYLKNRLLSALLPYAVWTLLYLLQHSVLNLLQRAPLAASFAPLSPNSVITHLLRGTAQYHLYFMLIAFQFYLLFPLLRWLLPRISPLALALGGSALSLGMTGYHFYTRAPLAPWLAAIDSRLFIHFAPWLGFFALGMAAGARYEGFLAWIDRYWRYCLAAAALLVPVLTYEVTVLMGEAGVHRGFATTFLRPSAIVYAVLAIAGLYGWARRLQEAGDRSRLWRPLAALGGASMGVYMVHPAVLTALELLSRKAAPTNPLWFFGLYTLLLPPLSYLAIWAVRRWPPLAGILGVR